MIGGLALGARGVVCATKDIDIVVSPDTENLKVAVAAGGHAIWGILTPLKAEVARQLYALQITPR